MNPAAVKMRRYRSNHELWKRENAKDRLRKKIKPVVAQRSQKSMVTKKEQKCFQLNKLKKVSGMTTLTLAISKAEVNRIV